MAMIFRSASLAIVALLIPPAWAQAAPAPATGSVSSAQPQLAAPPESAKPFSVDVSLGIVSDYRFRGMSLSNRHPAFQPGLTVTHQSGLYASIWGSTLTDNGGDDIEIDLVAGYAGQTGPISYGANATYYTYPGTSGLGYAELFGTLGTAIGPAIVNATLGYVPSQSSTGDRDNVYFGIDASTPLGDTPFTLLGSVGIEDGAFASAKRDWSLGIRADIGGFSVGLAYIGTAGTGADRLGNATAVVSASCAF